jgi:hypothetical protein
MLKLLETSISWCINSNLKVLVYAFWLLLLPLYLFAYLNQAKDDALYDLKLIKNTEKEST